MGLYACDVKADFRERKREIIIGITGMSPLRQLSSGITTQMLTNEFPSVQTEPPVSTDMHLWCFVHVSPPPLLVLKNVSEVLLFEHGMLGDIPLVYIVIH